LANDQRIASNTEDVLQKAPYKLNQIVTEHGLTLCLQEVKLMVFKGQEPVRNTIVIHNKITEQVNSFNYLRNLI
jgi:hypothetical protein